MPRIRFDFGTLTLDAELLDTPTAQAIADGAADRGAGADLGRGGLFRVPVRVKREADARAVVTPGEIAYWPEGPAIALGFGRTPISKGDECRLASPCNIFAKALGDVKALAKVRARFPDQGHGARLNDGAGSRGAMSLIESRREQIFPVLDAGQIETAKRFASGPARTFAPGETIFLMSASGTRRPGWCSRARSRSRAATASTARRRSPA